MSQNLLKSSLLAASIALTACGSGEAECTPAQCEALAGQPAPEEAASKPVPAEAPAQGDLTAFEKSLVDPMLEDLRAGVRPFNDHAVGICKGQGKDCQYFMGTDVGELPPGDFMVRAELQAPALGEDWTVNFATECETTKVTDGGSTTSKTGRDKDHTVDHREGDRGYRLSPLYNITSPNHGGAKSCTWTLTAKHPDGDKVYTGSWSVPAK
ncbi:MAG: hypothetical protein GWP91_18235 [Rhodobacterales bacterium]|nr:hypothetical protein [Rhodobacterales bacterium]